MKKLPSDDNGVVGDSPNVGSKSSLQSRSDISSRSVWGKKKTVDLGVSGGSGGATSVKGLTRKAGVASGLGISEPSSAGLGAKEKERMLERESKGIEEVRKEIELSQEEKEAGVEVISETVDLSEKIKEETGMEEVGPQVSISAQPTTVTLPLDDKQIKKAKKKNIVNSILWLAYWCLRQIKLFKKEKKDSKQGMKN